MSSSAPLSQSSTPGRPLKEAWIVEALRTPFGRYGGALAGVRPDDLAATVLEAVVARSGINAADIDDVEIEFSDLLLRGERVDDLRFAERAAIIAAPLIDPLLSGKWERFRSIDAALVAEAALGLALRRAGGRFTHDNEAMRRAAREWRRVRETGEEA